MKNIFCLLLILLFLLPLVAEARREPDHIGISKAQGVTPTQIVRGDAKIWLVNLVNMDALGAWLTLYDNYDHPLYEANIVLEIEVATAGNSEVVVLRYPIDVSNGLYVDKSWGSGTYIILYE